MSETKGYAPDASQARLRLDKLLDAGSFIEVEKYLERSNAVFDYPAVSAPGEGVITGWGTVDDFAVYVAMQDREVLEGSFGTAHAKKIVKMIDLARKSGLPIIFLWDSMGARLQEGIAAMDAYSMVMRKLVDISGVVPTISVVLGNMLGSAAMFAALTDITVVVENASAVSIASPTVIASAFGADADEQALIGANKQMEVGNAHLICKAEEDAFEAVRLLLSYLPANNLEETPIAHSHGPVEAPAAYDGDVRRLLKGIADQDSFLELQDGYAKEMITGFALFEGVSVAVVANAGGTHLVPEACEKAARFIRFADAFDLPILTIADNEGTAVTKDIASLRSLAKLVYAYSEAGTPMISIFAGRAIGEGYSVMSNRGNGADFVYALEGALIGPVGEAAGSIILYGNNEDEDAYRTQFLSPLTAAQQGVVDDIITEETLRETVIRALAVALHKRESKLPKKHGIMPL